MVEGTQPFSIVGMYCVHARGAYRGVEGNKAELPELDASMILGCMRQLTDIGQCADGIEI